MFIRPVTFAAMVLVTSLTAAEPNWAGAYAYTECWDSSNGDQKECVQYRLDIQSGPKGLSAILKVEGYMASYTLMARAEQKGRALKIIFLKFLGNQLGPKLQPGDLLFELESNKGKIYTNWVAIQPEYTRLPSIQFERIQGSSK